MRYCGVGPFIVQLRLFIRDCILALKSAQILSSMTRENYTTTGNAFPDRRAIYAHDICI